MFGIKNTKFIFFKLPKKNKILFYDDFNKYLKIFSFNQIEIPFIFNYSNRKLFFLFIISIFFKLKTIKIFLKENLITAYTFNFIEFINPKMVITTTDNNINFYRLKKYFKNINFVSLQNGSRHLINDLFGNPLLIKTQNSKKKYSCDVIFTFNSSIGKLYKKYIDTKTISIGCIRNNLIPKNTNFNKNTVLYISQFRAQFLGKKYYYNHGRKVTTIKKWFANEKLLLPLLAKYCERKKLKLVICGSSKNESHIKIEKNFFRKIIKNSNWTYWNKKKEMLDVYKFADKFELIVCVWSTLGLELFGRNKKVAFFRQKIRGYPDRNFGWPYEFPSKGFWHSNQINENEVSRILNNLKKIRHSDWIEKISPYKKKIMDYNYMNTKIHNHIANIVK